MCPILVGREPPLRLLENALLSARRGEGRLVLLGGEAGVGKSRLVAELRESAVRIGAQVLWGGCSDIRPSLPYLAFLESIGNHIGDTDLDGLRRQLGNTSRDLAQLFPMIALDTVAPDTSDPIQAKVRLYESVLTLIKVLAGERGLLLVLEDLHWSDASTRELLDYLIRRVRHTPILVVATFRDEELDRQHPLRGAIQAWTRGAGAALVRLEPMTAAQVGEMVRAIYDVHQVRRDLVDFLHDRSQGNPFVVEELLKNSVNRADVGRPGWERQALTRFAIPRSVRDLILLRLRSLSDDGIAVLRAAAVLGDSCDPQALTAVSRCSEEAVATALQVLVEMQVLEEDVQRPGRYRFRHSLTRDAVYQDLIAPERERLHARAAKALRAEGSSAVELCYHLLAARLWDEFVPLSLEAAEEAERAQAYEDAADLYERVLVHLDDSSQRARVLCRLGAAWLVSGDAGKAERHLQEGVGLLEALGEPLEAARQRLWLGWAHSHRSNPAAAQSEFEQAVRTLEPVGPSKDLALAHCRLAELHVRNMDADKAVSVARRAATMAEALHADAERLWAYSCLGVGMAWMGEVADGIDFLDRAYAEALERGLVVIAGSALARGIVERLHHFRAAEALERLPLLRQLHAGGLTDINAAQAEGIALWNLGDHAAALEALLIALEIAREGDAQTLVLKIERSMAVVYGELDRFDEAWLVLPSLDVFIDTWERMLLSWTVMKLAFDQADLKTAAEGVGIVHEAEGWPAVVRCFLGDKAVEILLSLGRQSEAASVVALTRDLSASRTNPHQMRMEGRVALGDGDLETAKRWLTSAAQLWRTVRERPEEWRTRRALAEARLRSGDRAGAQWELRDVLRAASKMGAAMEVRQVREQLALHGFDPGASGPPSGDVQLTGEKLVTVVFVDVRGYTATLRSQAPATLAERLAALYRLARDEVEARRGVVDKFAGDALMATFNVFGNHPNHCLHALQAVTAIRDKAGYLGFPVGAGIAVGSAIVGRLAQDANVSVIGEVTNLAARLQAKAAAGEILIDEEAFSRVRNWLQSERIEHEPVTLQLAGFAEPVVAFRLGHSQRHSRAVGDRRID